MNTKEKPIFQKPEMPEKFSTLEKFAAENNTKAEKSIADMLKIMPEINKFLSEVQIAFISPKEEPETGGFFDLVQTDKKTFIPTIFIVEENNEHLEKIMKTREKSAERVAELLRIDLKDLTPKLLKRFIVAHELGHAADYIKNYANNPEYENAAAEWDLHYEANLSGLPVPGLDPAELRRETSKFDNLKSFLKANPAAAKNINPDKIKTLKDLIIAQESAYRDTPYEKYADNFAAKFLKKHANRLGIVQLTKRKKMKKAA